MIWGPLINQSGCETLWSYSRYAFLQTHMWNPLLQVGQSLVPEEELSWEENSVWWFGTWRHIQAREVCLGNSNVALLHSESLGKGQEKPFVLYNCLLESRGVPWTSPWLLRGLRKHWEKAALVCSSPWHWQRTAPMPHTSCREPFENWECWGVRLLWAGSSETWKRGSVFLAACWCPKIPPVVAAAGLSTGAIWSCCLWQGRAWPSTVLPYV